MTNNNGGQAFPVAGSEQNYPIEGMTLRDFFAAKALQAIADPCHSPELFANRAYEIADAMLRAREAS
ncbi:TPA: hypothetical protein ACSRV8_001499 [Enterobacter hormaechei subsp. steigerwaltii]|jgi:hypothetical protein|uniref:hypothetical protein n=1 Tax=Enterobacter hormaechei TaxID=158836 RepID=UPI000735405B|nr:hypothetical protein [Enterobacter hormaechei]EKY3891004.1 hypothetical protein [Enterobacter hormaechei]EKY3938196.1 hypothetical protein [Enterobacter hormaechei]EKY4149085.1 hypothetical protein [Enterobacter hormaechei subsp. steigerwaltii]KTG83126.1 hypothetical protein ASV37_09310 [Enterobacter hormaechei subsp. steigerwaltii]KVK19994.1 hypothetical protein AWS16_23270 [Enterobacter hormaechei subsp. steigerwaltii]